jgi:peroxiredoxin
MIEDRTAHAARVGEPAPSFTLPDTQGRPTALAELTAEGPVFAVFLRGQW